jgi:Ca-activated chloride channel homolog
MFGPARSLSRAGLTGFAAAGVALLAASISADISAAAMEPSCADDAMIVFDASGSMSGNEKLGIATTVTRIDEVRAALARVLPSVTRHRRVGLITYGPGPYNQCNVRLNLAPAADAAASIMSEVNAITPAGKTPLTEAVERAAEILDFRRKPGVVVLVTDGEETCGRSPCTFGKMLADAAPDFTVHVIAFRAGVFTWMGTGSALEAKCLAERTRGRYVSAGTQDELADAFRDTLGCPLISERAAGGSGRSVPIPGRAAGG